MKYLNVSETAELARVSKRQVERFVKDGRLIPRRVSYKTVLFEIDEVIAMIESCKQLPEKQIVGCVNSVSQPQNEISH